MDLARRSLGGCIAALFLSSALGSAEDIYIAQTAQGSDTGANAANAHSVAWFNTSGNWGAEANKVSPGDTVHLCGTITTPLTVQGDGTAGNVTTILFESGANIAMLNLSAYAIDFNGHNYITVDGGQNGVIAAVDNGTTNTYQIVISGVLGHNVSNDTVQNLTITNLFIRTPNSTDPFGDQGPSGVTFYGNCANCTVRNCSISWAHTCVNLAYNSGNSSNIQVYSNLLKWCNWGVLDGGGANGLLNGLSVHDNTITGLHVWDDPSNVHHHNGIFVFAMNSGSWVGNLSIYNNVIGPDWGAGHSTAGIYVETYGTSDIGITNSLIYNNVAFSGNGLNCPDDAFVTLSHVNGARVYNNTFDGSTEGGRGVLTAGGANVAIANNIFSKVDPIEWEESNAIASSDYNDFYSPVNWTFSAWQAEGYDAHGKTGNPQFVNAAAYNFNIQSGSAAKDAGTSESAYFKTDILGTSRPQGSAWDIGAYEYLQGGTPSVTVSPASRSFGSIAVGATADRAFTVTNSGSGTLSGSASVPAPFLVLSGASYSLGAGQSQTVTVQYSPTAAGSNTQTVTFTGAAGATATVSGSAYNPASIAVTPPNPGILAGASQQLTATGFYSDGSTQDLTGLVMWSSSNQGAATINAGGLATGVSAGAATISAALAGVSGSAVLTVQAAPLAISTTSLPGGALNAAYVVALVASGGTAPYAWAVVSGSLPPGLALNSSSGAITGTPTAAGTYGFGIQVTDASGPSQSATSAFSITTVSTVTIWPATAVPAVVDGGADNPVELGVKFRSDVAGAVVGVRFYKASGNTGAHVGNLWSSSGTLLSSATFTGETASGWQQVNFAAPVAISSNTVYVASYHAPGGHYSKDGTYFASAGVDNAPLHALANGVSGGDGVYAYAASSAFPSQTDNDPNYWVDVAFQPAALHTPSPPSNLQVMVP